MARHEEGCGSVCINMFDILEGEGRTSEAWWNSTAFGHTGVEIR